MSKAIESSSSISGKFCAQDLWALMNIGKDCPAPEDSSMKEEFLNPLFIRAIRAGDIEKVRLLIELGVDINDLEPNSWTPLHYAACCGRCEILKLLIQNGAILDAVCSGPEKMGQTPLYQAALMNHVDCAKTLLLHGATISLGSEGICEPLLIAVFKGHVKMVALFLDYGANVNTRFTNNFFELFKYALPLEVWKDQDLPLLHYAILMKSNKIAAFLVLRGADINIETRSGNTTLLQAIKANNIEIARYLVTKRLKVDNTWRWWGSNL
ncbi:serine/threonine-protein phosphatase 6 regulatory ankyrin repeat subunit B-like [Cotesia glomerata]|uniref:serine/threonine-protein phosphatase 6 regulatory ankyrin repeat subunit B-like n=1 Tax=Cotesia glomerata TaxID=32391 RepID=UPI001D01C327|nr:serine/threonine-protein phosphatase 6 regulatory ankyrin repeat subunit B-like [Cotesia glomerata]